MKLLHADLHGFGKFHHQSFDFQDGLHVVYGANEAGKSTLHTFIGCMLFGLERGRGKAAHNDLYSRFLPWEQEGSYGGSLLFECHEQACLVERSFSAGRRSTVFSAADRGRISCPDNRLPNDYLEGLTKELFYNTLCVRQLQSAVHSSLAEQLSQHFRDIQQTGTAAVSYEAAAAWLKAEKKKLEAHLTPGLEENLEKKRQAAAILEEKLQDLSFLQTKKELEEKLALCMEQIGSLPDEAMVDELLSEEPFMDETTVDEPDTEQTLSEPASLCDPPKKRRPAILLCLFMLLCLCAALGLLWNRQIVPALCASAAALFFALAPHLLRRNARKPSSEDCPARDASPDNLRNSQAMQRKQAAASLKLRHQIECLQEQYRNVCRQEWAYERLAEQAQALDEELQALSGQMAQENELRLNLQAVGLALSTLQRGAARLKGQIGPHINASMSDILCGLTGGAYRQVYVNDNLEIALQTSACTIPLDALSRGTIEQVWLALRLAAIDIAFPQGGMPLLLDDCFLAYDDQRLSHTLSWLAEHYSGQVFLFTCQKREAALLQKERIPFTLIPL